MGFLLFLSFSFEGSLLLLEVLREQFLVLDVRFLGSLPLSNLALLILILAAESFVSDETLNAGSLVEGFVTFLDLTANDVFSNIILFAKSKSLSNLADSLRAESAGLLVISQTGDLTGTLLEHLKGKDAEIRASDAASDGLALALTSSLGAVRLDSYKE